LADLGFLKLQIVPSGRADQVAGAVSRAGGKAKARPRMTIRLRESLFIGTSRVPRRFRNRRSLLFFDTVFEEKYS
jgi:hypothetical protein